MFCRAAPSSSSMSDNVPDVPAKRSGGPPLIQVFFKSLKYFCELKIFLPLVELPRPAPLRLLAARQRAPGGREHSEEGSQAEEC